MAVRPPGQDDLAAIAHGYGMHLSDEDLGSFGSVRSGHPAPPGAAGPA